MIDDKTVINIINRTRFIGLFDDSIIQVVSDIALVVIISIFILQFSV